MVNCVGANNHVAQNTTVNGSKDNWFGRRGWGVRSMEAVIAGQEAVNAWQSDIPYYPSRPVRSSLKSSEHLDLR